MDCVLSFWDTIDSPTFAPLSNWDLSNNFVCAFEHPSLAPPRSPPWLPSGLRFQWSTLLPIHHVHSDHQAFPQPPEHLSTQPRDSKQALHFHPLTPSSPLDFSLLVDNL